MVVSSADALDTPTLGPQSPLLCSPGSPLLMPPTVNPFHHASLGEDVILGAATLPRASSNFEQACWQLVLPKQCIGAHG